MTDEVPNSGVINCQELRIVGQDGRTRAIFACTDDVPYIQLYDNRGRVRLQAQVEISGRPTFVLWDDTSPAVSIGMHDYGHGTRGITIHGARGYPVLTLAVNEFNETRITTLPGSDTPPSATPEV